MGNAEKTVGRTVPGRDNASAITLIMLVVPLMEHGQSHST